VLDVQMQERPGQWPVLLIGDIEPTTSVSLNEAEKGEIAKIRAGVEKEFSANPLPTGKEASLDRANTVTRQRAELRDRAGEKIRGVNTKAEERRPRHLIFVNTNDAQLLGWKKGQVRTVRGIIRRIGLFPTAASASTQASVLVPSAHVVDVARKCKVSTGAITELSEGMYYGVQLIIEGTAGVVVPSKGGLAVGPDGTWEDESAKGPTTEP
jgi:hypothetical protein